jgi:hypothetical protein
MNIYGAVQQLPLFAPPISPAMLVAAVAKGVDLSSVLSNTNAGTPSYRFSIVLRRAFDLCEEVRSLGARLLAALEKKDEEAVMLLRATHESNLLKAMRHDKALALEEAQATLNGLKASLGVITARQKYYQDLIKNGLSAYEQNILTEYALEAADLQQSSTYEQSSSQLSLIPNLTAGVAGAGGSALVTTSLGGTNFAAQASAVARYFSNSASQRSIAASMSSALGQWDRRAQEWMFQLTTVDGEIDEIKAQITAAEVRVEIAQNDQKTFDLQIQNAQTIQNYLTDKYTGAQLYSWMVEQISSLYLQSYKMAYDLAVRAEVGYRFERGLLTSNYIQFGYWDSLKKGLLAGENLYGDLKRLEVAFMETDVREYEIIRSISLILFDPWALINLKETGHCMVSVPEALFDMDYPGHYFRRIKSVSLTIPCVTGPYASVNCTLTLLNSKIRRDTGDNDYSSDAHFISNYCAAQSIATSTAQNDSGLFEVNFRDDRYLPFEGAGLVSSWRIDMPADCNTFDFETISDVVITFRYTARYGGDKLREAARKAAVMPARPQQPFSNGLTSFPPQNNIQRLFSLKHEYPTEWYRFIHPAVSAKSSVMQIALDNTRFPFQFRGKQIVISQAEIVVLFKDLHSRENFLEAKPVISIGPAGQTKTISLVSLPRLLNGAVYGTLAQPGQPTSTGNSPASWSLSLEFGASNSKIDLNSLSDILLLCDYKVS